MSTILNIRFRAILVLGPDDPVLAHRHWKWIEQTLNSSTAAYLLVGGHFPVWSVGLHGPTYCLKNKLMPLLKKYDVTAYLAGHDHNNQVKYKLSDVLLNIIYL